jgi:hypothetical protein
MAGERYTLLVYGIFYTCINAPGMTKLHAPEGKYLNIYV